MAEKVEKLGVNRDKDFMYYVKDAAVWRVQRKQPGVTKGRPEKVADGTFQMDTNFIYFVDKDGDVSRAKRAVGGQKRKKTGSQAKSRSAAKSGSSSGTGRSKAKSSGGKAKSAARGASKAKAAKPKGKAKAAAKKTKPAKAKSAPKSSPKSSPTKTGKKKRR